jgi:guanylate kinase
MADQALPGTIAGKITTYKPSVETLAIVRSTPILLLVGVSGAGKDSLKQQLIKSGRYHHIVSHTTRAPRMNRGVLEEDGREYHFISMQEAERMIDEHAFVEVKMYSGNLYGTSVAEVLLAHYDNKVAVTDIEVQGVAEYKEIDPNVKAIFVLPPNYEVWQKRLVTRYQGNIDETDYAQRMATARVELRRALTSNYFYYLINDELEVAAKATDGLVILNEIDPDAQEQARKVAESLLAQLEGREPLHRNAAG